MGEWIDGGYKEGEDIWTSEGIECVLLTSLGSLGWVAQEKETRRKIIVMFGEETSGGE